MFSIINIVLIQVGRESLNLRSISTTDTVESGYRRIFFENRSDSIAFRSRLSSPLFPARRNTFNLESAVGEKWYLDDPSVKSRMETQDYSLPPYNTSMNCPYERRVFRLTTEQRAGI